MPCEEDSPSSLALGTRLISSGLEPRLTHGAPLLHERLTARRAPLRAMTNAFTCAWACTSSNEVASSQLAGRHAGWVSAQHAGRARLQISAWRARVRISRCAACAIAAARRARTQVLASIVSINICGSLRLCVLQHVAHDDDASGRVSRPDLPPGSAARACARRSRQAQRTGRRRPSACFARVGHAFLSQML